MKLSDDFIKKALGIYMALIAALIAMLSGLPLVFAGSSKDPWPLGDGSTAYPVHNTYGQFQDYGYGGDYHDGIDIMVDASLEETICAIEGGTVDFVDGAPEDPSGDWSNFAMVILSDDDPTVGYCYVHFKPTAEWGMGDSISADAPIGTTVGYLDPSEVDYDHLHVSRIAVDPTSTAEFSYDFVENPLARLKSASSDTIAPKVCEILFFEDESTEKLESSSAFEKTKVDVVARISDRFLSGTDRPLIPYRVAVKITDTSSGATVYDNEIKFDGQFGTSRIKFVSTAYKNDGSVDLKGDYDDREFWVVTTNVLPDDTTGAWDTEEVGPGTYKVLVTAIDLAGNEDEMDTTVTVP